MTALVLLKALADMAFYYTLAGSLAALFGAPRWALWLSLSLAALALTGSYLLRERGRLRYLPFLLPLPVVRGGAVAALALLPALGYGLYQARAGAYHPDRGQEGELFSLFWKLLLALSLGGILYGKGALVSGFTLPCGVFAAACRVLLLRSLRHDPAVYEDRRYQRNDLLALGLLALLALALSSEPFLALCSRGAGAVYQALLMPLFSLLLWGMGMLLYGLVSLFTGLLHPGEKQEDPPMPDFGAGMEDQLQELQASAQTWAFWGEVLLALGTVLAVALVLLLLRRLSRSGTGTRPVAAPQSREERSAAPPPRGERLPRPREGRWVWQVRSQYRKFLRLCRDRGVALTPGQTSGDINALAREKLDGGAAGALRALYLPARYDGQADPQAAQRARELVDEMKK